MRLSKKSVKVLQCGFPKSGNYLLFSVLKSILAANGCWQSFTTSSGLGKIIDSIAYEFKIFPEINELDNLRIVGGNPHLEFPHPHCRFLSIDPELVIQYSSLIWTHELPTIFKKYYFANISHRFYLARDGRDVVNSLIYYVTNPISMKLRSEYKYSDPKLLYQNFRYFSKIVKKWRDHIRSFLQCQHKYILIRFEDLIRDKRKVIKQIGNNLTLKVPREKILQETSFGNMSQKAADHVRKGIAGDWREHFSTRHLQIFNKIAANELEKLGYVVEE